MNTFEKAEAAIIAIDEDRKRYNSCAQCWLSVAPLNARDFFRRWLFAYASIQTQWECNIRIYKSLKDLEWLFDDDKLRQLLTDSGAGMYNGRTTNISKFSRMYWDDPKAFYGQPGETWYDYRDRLAETIPGMGVAKTSFVLEMTWPIRSEVICIDTHIMQLYGCKPVRLSKYKYKELERHWVSMCHRYSLAPPIARAVYWDINKGYSNSDYWNGVFREERSIVKKLKKCINGLKSRPRD